jgi:hypothetical protein
VPLVGEKRARPPTYRTTVDVKVAVFGAMVAQRSPLNLDVHGDSFRVFHPFPPIRLVFRQDYSFRGPDTVIEVVPGLLHEWIEILGPLPLSGASTRIQIARRKQNRVLWDVLLAAGARPAGPPPP